MAEAPPNLKSGAFVSGRLRLPAATLDAVLGAALAAYKAGTLDELLARRPRAARWFARRLLPAAGQVAGDALDGEGGQAIAFGWVLCWAVTQLRPDRVPSLAIDDRSIWLERTSWRPMLSVMCHFGFAPVPAFRDRYHPRTDESAAEQLCGLWDVGPSTYYRYLEKGRRRLVEQLREAPTGDARLSLYTVAQQALDARLGLADDARRVDWHRTQAVRAAATQRGLGALWHALNAGDPALFVQALTRFRVQLAALGDTDVLIDALARRALSLRQSVELNLARAALWRVRDDAERERGAYEQAQRLAQLAGDTLMLGIVSGALGKFYEHRDADRAFACYQDSAAFLRDAGASDAANAPPEVVAEYVSTLVKLAWLHVLRNDPRAKVVLDHAQALGEAAHPAHDVVALLEQAWGEYWRRAGQLTQALEHKHRALNIYERLGDEQAILKTYCNLSLIYGDAKDFARSIDYSQRVLAMAERLPVEPETVVSTHLNLGATYFWQGRYDPAIEQYQQALHLGQRTKQRLNVGRAHYNLAEAYYKRFQAFERPEDERLGDAHAAAAMAAWPGDGDPGPIEATRGLKAEILGPREGPYYDRLLPDERAAHFEQMNAVQQQRRVLALPGDAAAHVRAHLAIANAYLAISVAEREAAWALVQKHGLEARFAADFDQLRHTFDESLTREQRLSSQWQHTIGDLLSDDRRAAVLHHLVSAGSINKSAYAQLCAVGPATASKHLGILAERGLLQQSGRGPATRYTLAQ